VGGPPGAGSAAVSTPPASDPTQLPLASATGLAVEREPQWPQWVIGAGFVIYGVMIVVGLASGTFEVVEAIPLVPILAFITYRIGQRIAFHDADPSMVRFVFAAFWAKMIGALVRAGVVAWLYGNRSDALDYHRFGQALAPMFRGFDFSQAPGLSGTNFMRTFTGVIYMFTGASKVSGAIVMSFFSFLGCVLLWRAFRMAVPGGLARRYALLVLFLPSLLYWPSALGKEGYAILCLGIASYGVARVVSGSIGFGILVFALGLWGVSMIRPHVALTMFSGVALAGVVGKSRKGTGVSGVLRIVLFGVLFVMFGLLASSTATFFGVDSLNEETVNQTLLDAEGQTAEAGSAFSPVRFTANPPLALATVLYRPFPFEASSVVALATAAEGVFLFVLTVKSLRRLASIPRQMRRAPYVAYSLGILVTFVYAFSAFSNFGILARQRCQVMPFFLVLLCLPEWRREGVISVDEAVRARDTPSRFEVEPAPDPYAANEAEVREVIDPYAGLAVERDPYERFRRDDRR
jgi:hypothetical protein